MPLDSVAERRGAGSSGGSSSSSSSSSSSGAPATAWGLLVGLPSEATVRASVIEELSDVFGESKAFLRDASLAELLRHAIREKDEL